MSRLTIKDTSRLLIATYFIGLGLGVFHGPEAGRLFEMFGLGAASGLLSGLSIIVLASLIFLDIRRGLAVALLALLIFVASYSDLITAVGRSSVGGFWRDMSIIGLLLLVLLRSGDPETRAPQADPVPADPQPSGKTDRPGGSNRPPHPRRVRTEIFRQDFDAARAP